MQAEHPASPAPTAESDDSASALAVEDLSLGGSDLSQTLAEVTSFLSFPMHAHYVMCVCTFTQCWCLLHLQTAAAAAAKLLSVSI